MTTLIDLSPSVMDLKHPFHFVGLIAQEQWTMDNEFKLTVDSGQWKVGSNGQWTMDNEFKLTVDSGQWKVESFRIEN